MSVLRLPQTYHSLRGLTTGSKSTKFQHPLLSDSSQTVYELQVIIHIKLLQKSQSHLFQKSLRLDCLIRAGLSFFLEPLRFAVVQLLSHVRLFVNSWTVAHQALCPWGFSRRILESLATSFSKGSWIKFVSPALAGSFFTTKPPGKLIKFILYDSVQLLRNSAVQRITRS